MEAAGILIVASAALIPEEEDRLAHSLVSSPLIYFCENAKKSKKLVSPIPHILSEIDL